MKVLLVEDNQQIMETLADFLEFRGHQVDCAYHGEAALVTLQQQRFDIIVMDIMKFLLKPV
ncbi:MAG: response regulator [Rheinheimera sp.]|nr:MAG: response regulator [Rheinheimera sp.]